MWQLAVGLLALLGEFRCDGQTIRTPTVRIICRIAARATDVVGEIFRRAFFANQAGPAVLQSKTSRRPAATTRQRAAAHSERNGYTLLMAQCHPDHNEFMYASPDSIRPGT